MSQYQPSGVPPEVAPGSQARWYYRKWFVILMLILVFPVGLVLLWRSPETKLSGRIVWSALVALVLAINLTGGEGEAPTSASGQAGSTVSDAAGSSGTEPSAGAATASGHHSTPVPEPAQPPKEPQWNTADLDATANGNLPVAVQWLKGKEPEWVRSNADTSVEPSLAMKSPWKYYGKPLALTGTVGIAQAYPPGSDIGKAVGGEVSEFVTVADDGTVVDFMMIGDSGNIKVGDLVTVYGLVIGQVDVENKMGGQTTQLMVVGNSIQGM